jgi:hypothetical protein
MPRGSPDQLPESGLGRVMIYEDERFVRTDREWITYSMAKKLAEEFNLQFGHKRNEPSKEQEVVDTGIAVALNDGQRGSK